MTDNEQREREDDPVEKASFEQVPASRAADRILRRRRKPRGLFSNIFRNIRKLVRGTGSR
jgi:hypothetical protein